MSSTSPNADSEQTNSTEEPLTIQQIIERLTHLFKNLQCEAEADIDAPQQPTAATTTNSAAADNQTGNNQDEIKTQGGDGSQQQAETNEKENKNTEPHATSKRVDVKHELDKLCKELQHMLSSFEKLKKFSINLKKPLETLEQNVGDILKDLPRVTDSELPKQVSLNLRVLKNNITRVKIQIPLQHQATNANSEANRSLQTTVATSEADDMPQLYNEEGVFENSYFFKEIEEKYKHLDVRQKLCLLCFAVFPENAEIKKRLLRFWWVGENLVSAEGNEEEKKIVSDTLETFVEKGFIVPIQKKNKLQPRSYKMTPIVRSCLIKFAKAAGFFDYDGEGKPTMNFFSCKKACMVKSQGAPVRWFSDYLNPTPTSEKQGNETQPANDQRKDRLSADLLKLQMLFNFPERRILEKASKQFHELQTLFNVSKQFPALPKEWLSKMTNIKVLYLGRWESKAGRQRHIEVEDIDFLRGLKNMKNLRLLSLQGISGIPRLPSSLCKLASLKILDLRACHNLEKLPDRIGLLKKLTYLDLSECYLLDDVPKQLNKLSELEVLKGFVIGNGKNSCTLEDLAELKKLRKLSVNVSTTEFDIEDAEKALSKFENLEKLRIAWGSGGLTGGDNSAEKKMEPKSPAKSSSSRREKLRIAWGSGGLTGGDISAEEKMEPKSPAKSSSSRRDKEEDNGNGSKTCWKRGKEDSKNKEKDKEEQSNGAANSADKKPDSEKQGTGSLGAFSTAVRFGNRLKKLLTLRRKPEDLKGLEKLVKLDFQCFPNTDPPKWLVPGKLKSLKNLSVRGGRLGHLIQEEQVKWGVEILRLKFLINFTMNWKDMQEEFPELKYLENVRCPRITFCPTDASGVWQKSSKSN
ncbi:disease resistance RPP13-like protein 4-like protein [Corchorus capsularis]|uniref:Disease resistance RPP13-like protein 4-like protein n=1 Tax=Corchorus capsularis TaxID=210143 RepID=A0A1R3IZ78_COCAP|nr:disease resistance RPP13-like protein 4-like protein [Corchorus capsularis]